MSGKFAFPTGPLVYTIALPLFLTLFSMSKKVIAALSMSLMLAACSTTADVTVDETDDAMMEDSSSEAMVDDSSSSSVEAMEGTGAMMEDDTTIDAGAESSVSIAE